MPKKVRTKSTRQEPAKPERAADHIAELVSKAKWLLPELQAGVVTSDWLRRAEEVAGLACSCNPHMDKLDAINRYEAELKAKGMGEEQVRDALLKRHCGLPLRDEKEKAVSMACQTIFKVLSQLIRQPFIPSEMFPKAHAAISGAVESLRQYAPPGNDDTKAPKDTGPIFIGHGGSEAWMALKDFIVDDLGLHYEEFDKEPPAGKLLSNRLDEMVEKCRFAFLVMTAEDERLDGKVQARQNVVHEFGRCQERYGSERAIILLEEGCERFSNTQGIVHIQFPKGNILAKKDDIRRVLEREGILSNQADPGQG